METLPKHAICKRCHSPKVKDWGELTEKQRHIMEHLPEYARLGESELKRMRYCTNCWAAQNGYTRDA